MQVAQRTISSFLSGGLTIVVGSIAGTMRSIGKSGLSNQNAL